MNMFVRSLSWIICSQMILLPVKLSYSTRISDRAMDLIQISQSVQSSKGHSPKLGSSLKPEEIPQQLYSLDTDYESVAQKLDNRMGFRSQKIVTPLKSRIRKIFTYIDIVQASYKSFLTRFSNDGNFSLQQHQNLTNTSSPERLTNSVQVLISEFTSLTTENLTSIVQRGIWNGIAELQHCSGTQSKQELLYQFYEAVALSCAKAAIVELYEHDMDEKLDSPTREFLKSKLKTTLLHGLNKMSGSVRDVLPLLSKKISTCPISDFGDALQIQVFQKYLVHQSDMANVWRATFDTCSDFKRERAGCDSKSCLELPEHKRCRGELRDCETVPDNIFVCFSFPKDPSRYKWMETESGEKYGCAPSETECNKGYGWAFNNTGCNKIRKFNNWFPQKFCFCNCEDEKMDIDRHFSLTNATSDIQDNKVVTGARLVKRNHVFYIQIQQGELGSSGSIVGSPEWKEVDEVPLLASHSSSYSKLVYTVTHDQNKFQLDDVHAGPNELLTGLRFAQISNFLILQIRKTPFNPATGELHSNKTSWYPPESILRQDESQANAGSGKSSRSRFIKPLDPVRFRVTNMKDDLGQNTIPLLDAQPVVSDPPMPLSGAGLWLRDSFRTVEFLTLELFNYDLTALM